MVKIITSKSIVAYLIAYAALFMYFYISEHGNINSLSFVKTLVATSGIYLASYWGLKLGSFRLREEDILKKFIDKLHVPSREIIVHICLVMVCIVFLVVTDTSPVVEHKKIDENVLVRIEEACGRTDITEIVEFDGKYFITFSDNSKKLLQLDKK